MLPDFKELLKSFNDHDVKYLVVGGYAVSFHAQPRATKDLDIFIRADAENAKAVYAALASFGAPLEGIHADDLANPTKFIRLGREPVAVDLLPSIDGIDFDTAWSHRVSGVIDSDPASRLTVFFISEADLIASKIAAGRMRDLADVEELRNSAGSRKEQG
jgi:predicted nucleotidyltransferase